MKEYHVMLQLTQRCNLECLYCFSYNNSNSALKVQSNNFEEFYNITMRDIEDFLLWNPDYTKIKFEFFGGEPLIEFELIKRFIIKAEENRKIEVSYEIPTNGILLTNDMIDFLSNYPVQISISYDGLWDDINRPQSNGNNKKQKPNKSVIKYGVEKNIINHIHCMIYPMGLVQNTILNNYLFLIKHFPKIEIKFEIVKDNNIWVETTVQLLIEQLLDFIKFLFRDENLNKKGYIPSIFIKPLIHIIMVDLKNIPVKHCGILENRTLIAPDLREYPCNIFLGKNMNLSNINNDLKKALNNSKCLNCGIYKYCDKGCPAQMLLPSTNRRDKQGNFIYYSQEQYLCDIFIALHKLAMLIWTKCIQNPNSALYKTLQNLIKNEGI